jgi:hypothetical protein
MISKETKAGIALAAVAITAAGWCLGIGIILGHFIVKYW